MPDHDSGCKMKWPLLPGVIGSAIFRGAQREHRLVLMRGWDDLVAPILLSTPAHPSALWIGMNPSGAEGDVDDLTVRKEQTWTRMLGFSRYLKVNVGTYRWTDSLTLGDAAIPVMHPENLPLIRKLAATAAVIILTTGKPPEILMPHIAALRQALKEDGRMVKCLGTTKDGWPKHSSRIGYNTPFVDFAL